MPYEYAKEIIPLGDIGHLHIAVKYRTDTYRPHEDAPPITDIVDGSASITEMYIMFDEFGGIAYLSWSPGTERKILDHLNY